MHAPFDGDPIAAPPRTSIAARVRACARSEQWVVTALLIAAAFAIRGWQFGTPFIQVDEDFYLFVGDRMLHGALPYVDLWDRKPLGLFLLYAAIRLLGGGGIVQYQVVATVFAGATAGVVARIASRYAPPLATFFVGLVYLVLLGLNEGMGGQAPVFYNLFVALAALLTLKATTQTADPARILRLGTGAMAMCGIAMQIKYNAVFEGVFFGIVLMLASWRARGTVTRSAADAALWIAAALAPTLLAYGYYAVRGEGAAFLYANFASIFARGAQDGPTTLKRLIYPAKVFTLPLICVLVSACYKPVPVGKRGLASHRFVLAWLGTAIAGYLIFGTYFKHYALPLAGPVAAAAAPLFGEKRWRIGTLTALLLLGIGAWRYERAVQSNLRLTGGAPALRTALAVITPRVDSRHCLWIFRGDTLLYYEARSCLLSTHPFPSHFWKASELHATGMDPIAEVRRIIAMRPPVIVDQRLHHELDVNPAVDAIVYPVLARDYRLAATTGQPTDAVLIYVRRDPGPPLRR